MWLLLERNRDYLFLNRKKSKKLKKDWETKSSDIVPSPLHQVLYFLKSQVPAGQRCHRSNSFPFTPIFSLACNVIVMLIQHALGERFSDKSEKRDHDGEFKHIHSVSVVHHRCLGEHSIALRPNSSHTNANIFYLFFFLRSVILNNWEKISSLMCTHPALRMHISRLVFALIWKLSVWHY